MLLARVCWVGLVALLGSYYVKDELFFGLLWFLFYDFEFGVLLDLGLDVGMGKC